MRQRPAPEQSRFGKEFSVLTFGWGAWIRTRGWRNQNQLDYPIISMRIWKKRAKTRSRNFNSLAAVSK
jgi:hypothetical protein